jgi:hypothetical protein
MKKFGRNSKYCDPNPVPNFLFVFRQYQEKMCISQEVSALLDQMDAKYELLFNQKKNGQRKVRIRL